MLGGESHLLCSVALFTKIFEKKQEDLALFVRIVTLDLKQGVRRVPEVLFGARCMSIWR
jgi:hypothetical protein